MTFHVRVNKVFILFLLLLHTLTYCLLELFAHIVGYQCVSVCTFVISFGQTEFSVTVIGARTKRIAFNQNKHLTVFFPFDE